MSEPEKHFQIKLPIAQNGVHWNGRPDEFNNIGYNLDFSQMFGLTEFAKTGIYGYTNGKPNIHTGNDFAGVRNTPLVAPRGVEVTYIGYEKNGYGNFLFMEDEYEIQYVLAHCNKIVAEVGKWYEQGEIVAYMGSTGLSTGNHTHFGMRPLKNGKWVHKENRGYIDPMPYYVTKPVYNKQDLYDMQLPLITKKGEKDVYAISPDGKANLIINWSTFQKGLEMNMWKEEIDEVDELPEMGKILILVNNN